MVDCSGDIGIAESAWHAFVTHPEHQLPARSRAVQILDLLDEEVDVTPARWLAADPDNVAMAEGFVPASTELRSAVADLAEALPELELADERVDLPMTTIGELAKAGLITIHQAPMKMTTEFGELPVLTAKDVRLGRSPSGRADPEPGMLTVEPGDVVVPAVPREPVARLITEPGAVLGPQLMLFRVDPERIDPHFVAGYLRLAGNMARARSLSTSSRMDVRRAPIPRLPLAEQRRYGEAFRRLAAFEDALHQAKNLGETVLRLGFAGLGDGALRPVQ
jgi:hypothetical protein